jgi:hypothetical protein
MMTLVETSQHKKNKSSFLLFNFFKKMFILAISLLFLIVISRERSFAAINETVNIEGKLVNVNGTNPTAACIGSNTCDFRLNIYNASSGGTLLWSEIQTNVQIVDGIFSLKMGAVTSLNDVDLQNFDRDDLWVQIDFDPSGTSNFTSPESFTRSRLSAVPYAMNSKYLGGLSSTDFLRSNATTNYTSGTLTFDTGTSLNITDIAPGSVVFAGAAGQLTDNNLNFYWDVTNNRLGLGLNNPDATLAVNNDMVIRRTGSISSLIFTNTAGTGDFRIAGDGNDFFWQGGGNRALQMGSYWETVLMGGVQSVTPPAFRAGTSGRSVLVMNARATDVSLAIQGFAGQTANLTEWQNSAGLVLSRVNSDGSITVGATGQVITTALDVSQTDIVNAINLGSNDILMDDNGEVNWNDTAGSNLMRMRDVATNFGLALDAGAFIDRNSALIEEFNKFRTSRTVDTTGNNGTGFGDGGGWGVYESTACTFSTVADSTNGLTRMQAGNVNNGCLMMVDRAANVPHAIASVASLPTIIMKVRPSAVSTTNITFAGLSNNTDGVTVDPTNFVGFTNVGGTTWQARTTSGGSSTTVSCGVAVSTTQFALLKVEVRSSTDIRFFIDGDVSNGVTWTECGTGIAANIPAINLAPQLHYQTRGGTNNSYLDVDFYRMWQDDNATVRAEVTEVIAENSEVIQSESEEVALLEENVVSENLEEAVVNSEADDLIDATELDALYSRLNKVEELLTLLNSNSTFESGSVLGLDNLDNNAGNITSTALRLNNGLEINNGLSVFGKSILNGGLFVYGNAEVSGDLFVKGNVIVSADNAGYAMIRAGEKQVKVVYTVPRLFTPVITATPTQNIDLLRSGTMESEFIAIGDYRVINSTGESFIIELREPAQGDIYFSWYSISVESPTLSRN